MRSNERGECGFVKDGRRGNVGVTRARRGLVVVGDSETVGVEKGGRRREKDFWGGWMRWVEEGGEVRYADVGDVWG